MKLTNAQGDRIEKIIASLPQNQEWRGRPQRHPREVLDGTLWVLRTGASWKDVHQRYPPYQTCHRRFQQGVRQGVFKRIIHELAEDLYERGGIDIRETFIDRSFAPAKKRTPAVGNTKRRKGTKIMAVADASGLPIATHVESASPHEVKLVAATLARRFVDPTPERLIGGKFYDSEGLDRQLESELGIKLIAPHRSNRAKPQSQDGRALRRYKRRWKIERFVLPGCIISDAWWCATSIMPPISSACFNLAVPLSCYGNFEMASTSQPHYRPILVLN